MIGRGVTLRCPQCGGRDLFASWFKLRAVCPTCGLELQRGEQDHWFGGFAVNFALAEVIGIGLVLVFLLATWPDVPWTIVQFGAPMIMLVLPFLFFPFSRTIYLAVDLHFRPDHQRR